MEIKINDALSGTLNRLAQACDLTEQETAERFLNDFLLQEFKNNTYAQIQSSNLDDFAQVANVMATKKLEIDTAKITVEPIEEINP